MAAELAPLTLYTVPTSLSQVLTAITKAAEAPVAPCRCTYVIAYIELKMECQVEPCFFVLM